MCGIIGINSNKSVSATIINSLKKLEYRGYDSAGIATLSGGLINEVKSSIPKEVSQKVSSKIEDGMLTLNLDNFNSDTKDAYFWFYLCSEFSQLSDDIKRCQQEMRIVKKIMGNKLNDEEIKDLKKEANDWYNQFIS